MFIIFGSPELLVLSLILSLVLLSGRLPHIGRSLGAAIRAFRKEVRSK